MQTTARGPVRATTLLLAVRALSVLSLAFAACDDSEADAAAASARVLAVEVCEEDEQCGLSRLCVCGRCTIPCGSDERCQLDAGPPLACYRSQSELLADRCEGLRPEVIRGVCLQTCDADSACEDDQQCRNGACVPQLNRSGKPATSGRPPGVRPSEGDSGTAVPPAGSGCLSEPSRVTFLGDSYVAEPVQLRARVERRARSEGLLDFGVEYRDFAAAGARLAPPFGTPGIAEQWARASRGTGSVALVVMSGGGEDVFSTPVCLADDSFGLPECVALRARLMSRSRELLMDMRDNEAGAVLWVWYPDAPAGGHALLADVLERTRALCGELEDERFRCEVLDTRPTFAVHPHHFVGATLPSEMGSEALADLVWPRMRALCPAQP